LRRVLRGLAIATASLAIAGCGGSGLKGTLAWDGTPDRTANALRGTIVNTTSNTVTVDPKTMRLLDDDGRKVAARIRLAKTKVPPGGTTAVTATWRKGDPTRLDYGAGTLQLPGG
jgi:hypothetical protein